MSEEVNDEAAEPEMFENIESVEDPLVSIDARLGQGLKDLDVRELYLQTARGKIVAELATIKPKRRRLLAAKKSVEKLLAAELPELDI
jgi:hypothetical protein